MLSVYHLRTFFGGVYKYSLFTVSKHQRVFFFSLSHISKTKILTASYAENSNASIDKFVDLCYIKYDIQE